MSLSMLSFVPSARVNTTALLVSFTPENTQPAVLPPSPEVAGPTTVQVAPSS